jgi:site-specific DNA-methyltransferase (adenine-specific)
MANVQPYYSDDSVTLYHGDCREVLPTLAPATIDVLLTDPPYFQVKDEDWDRQWKGRQDFLAWVGDVLGLAKPLLLPSASVWVFASPAMERQVEGLVGERFRVLNSIRWVKDAGWHRKADAEAQRRFLTPWEAIVFAEQYADAYGEQALALHKSVFAPLGRYLAQAREAAGLTRCDVEVALGYTSTHDPARGTALCYRWEEGSSLPTMEAYERLRTLLGSDRLAREYDDLRREYDDLRRPFELAESGPTSDLWDFAPVMSHPGKHPCEKPLSMLRHMLATSSRLESTVLDPFAGSGATLLACKELGRRAVGIELEERWCEAAAKRLSQEILPLSIAPRRNAVRVSDQVSLPLDAA